MWGVEEVDIEDLGDGDPRHRWIVTATYDGNEEISVDAGGSYIGFTLEDATSLAETLNKYIDEA